MICAIVLAAGRSRRMGTQKLLLPYGGQTLIGHILDQVIRSPVEVTLVVTGADHEAVVGGSSGRDVTFVRNPAAEAEMLSSIRCGIRALPGSCRAAVIVLGDQPGVTAGLIGEIVRGHVEMGRAIVVPTFGGRRGHPVLISARHFGEVLSGFDDVGLRGLVRAHPEDVLEVEAGLEAVLMDLDTPEDYRRATGVRPESRT
jgi:molybdenum cofactor cytidylyltransferase